MPAARRKTEQDSLAGTASERVRAIIEAAEASAAAIREEAEAEAERITADAEKRASALRSEVRSDVEGLIASIRDGFERLRGDLEQLEARLGESHAPGGRPAPAAERPASAVAVPESPEEPELALAEDAAVGLDQAAPDLEGARLVALNMALDGAPREEIARHLRETQGVAEPSDLLDQVYESIGRS